MRRSGLLLVVLVTALVLQTSLLPALAIAGYRPDLLLLITTVVALRDGGPSGLRVGAAAGLMTDLLVSDAYLGISVITSVVVAYGVAAVRPYLTSGSPFVGPAVGAAAALVGTLAHGVLASLLAETIADVAQLARAALATAVWAALLWPVIDAAVGRLLAAFPVDVPSEAV